MHEKITITKVDPLTISKQHMDQLIALVISTDHFQCYTTMHKRNTTPEFIKTNFIIPYLPHTKIMLDKANNIIGFYAALTKNQDNQIVKDKDWNQDNLDVQLLFNTEGTLLKHITDHEYFLSLFAIHSDLHGVNHPRYNKKISLLLFEELLREARDANSNCLATLTWGSHAAAIKLYKHYGGQIVHKCDLSQSIFADELVLIKIPL